jgi:hypothetical protein
MASDHHNKGDEMKKAIRGAVAAGAAGLAVSLMGASGATANDFERFANCPVNDATVVTCVHAEVSRGEFVLGRKTVPIDQTIVLQGGLTSTGGWVNPTSGLALSEPELNVPGGILGVPGWEGPLLGVKSIAKLRGTPIMSVARYAGQNGVALELPIRIQLKNPMLNADCSIGSTSNPVVLKLSTGTTAPPAPNVPITGSRGTPANEAGGKILRYTMNRLVDNSFAAPKAQWCDWFGTNALITLAVNSSVGLPSAAGTNTADMGGDLRISSKANVKAGLGI